MKRPLAAGNPHRLLLKRSHPKSGRFLIGGSCNGLIYFDNLDGDIVVWNPSTEEIKSLPSSDVPRPSGIAMSASDVSGFGFDSNSQDYKVIRFMTHFYEDEQGAYLDHTKQAELFSLNNNSWKEVPDAPDVCLNILSRACANGNCYWLDSDCRDPLKARYILSYDFTNGCFSYFPHPVDKKDRHTRFDLVEFDGSLGFTVFRKPSETDQSFELWVLNLKERSWAKVFELNLPSDVEKALGFFKDCNGLLCYFEGIDSQLLVYNCTTKELKKVDTIEELGKVDFFYHGKVEIFSYVESPISLQMPGSNMDTSCKIHEPEDPESNMAMVFGEANVDSEKTSSPGSEAAAAEKNDI